MGQAEIQRRVAVLTAPGAIQVETRATPRPGPHEVLVKVAYAGVCGTDVALYEGTYPADLPLVLGHECCGHVTEIGPEVPERWRGAFVAPEINLTCISTGEPDPCPMCRRSLPSHCRQRRVLGIRGADGAFADRLVVPAGSLHLLPEDLSPWAGAIVEPLAAALHTFELTKIEPGNTVVVLGTGRLGLLVCRVARSYGAWVTAVSRSRPSRELALRFSANEALDSEDPDTPRRVRERTEGLGADVVVDCTGSPEGLGRALGLVRARGTVAMKSTCGRPAVEFDATDLVVREVTVQGSRCGPFPKAIERLSAGLIPVDDYVAGVYPLEETREAIEASRHATKILIEVDP